MKSRQRRRGFGARPHCIRLPVTRPLPDTVASTKATTGGGGGVPGRDGTGAGMGGGGGMVAAMSVGESTTSRQRGRPPSHPRTHCDTSSRVSVTSVPDSNETLQVGRQSIPEGSLVTWAYPSTWTVSGCSPGLGNTCPKAAAISVGPWIGRVHALVPAAAQCPSQPAKRPSAAASGVRVTVVPYGTSAPQPRSAPPQLIEASELTTRPGPPTESKSGMGWATNDAVALCERSSATSQIGAVPMQSPSHFTKSNPSLRNAVSLRRVPLRNDAEHRLPRSIRPSLLVILPPAVTLTLRTRPFPEVAAAPETVQSIRRRQIVGRPCGASRFASE